MAVSKMMNKTWFSKKKVLPLDPSTLLLTHCSKDLIYIYIPSYIIYIICYIYDAWYIFYIVYFIYDIPLHFLYNLSIYPCKLHLFRQFSSKIRFTIPTYTLTQYLQYMIFWKLKRNQSMYSVPKIKAQLWIRVEQKIIISFSLFMPFFVSIFFSRIHIDIMHIILCIDRPNRQFSRLVEFPSSL